MLKGELPHALLNQAVRRGASGLDDCQEEPDEALADGLLGVARDVQGVGQVADALRQLRDLGMPPALSAVGP